MRPIVSMVAVLSFLAGCMPGFDDCAVKPFGAAAVAALSPPRLPDGGPMASCGSTVEFDGRRYHGMGGRDMWTVPLEDLEPIGLASAANGSGRVDNTVFAISGVEPDDAIAMRYGADAAIVVLLTDGG